MALINVGESEFSAVAGAAVDAARRGDKKSALVLDKLARKINCQLSRQTVNKLTMPGWSPRQNKKLTWRDIDSVLVGIPGVSNEIQEAAMKARQ